MINPERCDNNFVFLKISMILSCSEKVLLSEKRKEKKERRKFKKLAFNSVMWSKTNVVLIPSHAFFPSISKQGCSRYSTS